MKDPLSKHHLFKFRSWGGTCNPAVDKNSFFLQTLGTVYHWHPHFGFLNFHKGFFHSSLPTGWRPLFASVYFLLYSLRPDLLIWASSEMQSVCFSSPPPPALNSPKLFLIPCLWCWTQDNSFVAHKVKVCSEFVLPFFSLYLLFSSLFYLSVTNTKLLQ